jgi:hypothetical protein
MKRFTRPVVPSFMLAVLSVVVFSAISLPAADFVLTGGTVYPSPDTRPIADATIIVRDGHIAAMGPGAAVRIPKGAQVLDCSGRFVVAGFWNSHVHILTPGLLHARDSASSELNEQLDLMFNRWGFTTVFDVGSVLNNTLALRARIESGELSGPHLLTVGEPIWTIEPVYVREFLKENHISIPDTGTPAQGIALVRDHAAKGANGIKLFTGSYQGGGKVAVLPLSIAQAGGHGGVSPWHAGFYPSARCGRREYCDRQWSRRARTYGSGFATLGRRVRRAIEESKFGAHSDADLVRFRGAQRRRLLPGARSLDRQDGR